MKSTIKIKSLLWIACLSFMIALPVSCKKEKSVIVPTTLTSDKGSYTPSELVVGNISDALIARAEVTGTVNGQSVKILIVNSQASFLVPDSSPGALTIKFEANKLPYEVTLNVIAGPEVKKPEVYFASIDSSMNANVASLLIEANNADLSAEVRAAAAADAKKYAESAADYKQQYEKLSSAEKQEFAKIVAANIGWINEFKNKVAEYRVTDISDFEAKQYDLAKKWLNSFFVLTENTGKLAILIYAAPVIAGIPIIGTIGAGVAIGYMFTEFASSLSITIAYGMELYNLSMVPYGKLDAGDQVLGDYNNGQQKTFNISGGFRKLIAGDENNSELTGTLKTLAEAYIKLKQEVGDLINKMPEKLRPSFAIPTLKSEIQESNRFINAKYLTLNNLSNSKVKLAFQKLINGGLRLTASTTELTNQEFTFDINYANPSLSAKTLTTKVTSKVIAISPDYSIEVYENIVDINIGTSKVTTRAGALLATLQPNDALKVSPSVGYAIKLKYKGNYVKVSNPTFTEAGQREDVATRSFYNSKFPLGATDQTDNDYIFNVADMTNKVDLKIPLKVTYVNDLYRSVVGKTVDILVLGSSVTRVSLKLLENGKIGGEGVYGNYTYSLGSDNDSRYIKNCSNFQTSQGVKGADVDKKILGTIFFDLKGGTPAYIPSSLIVLEGGTGSAGTSFSYCNDIFIIK